MKKTLSLFVSIFLWIHLAAQSISVASFSLLENDLAANTTGTTVLDQNGEKCALIKVETTQTGFTFEVGALGVVKTEQHTAEIWVYVPAGVKRISIAHQQLGRLNDFDLGMTLQKAKTYRQKLTTGTVTTVVEEAVTSQFLLFQVEPAHAMVLVNEEPWTVNDGVARKYVPFGTYNYRVMAQDYYQESGRVTVNDPNQKQLVQVSLKPNFVQVTLRVDNQAEIWVNGEQKGRGSWTGNLGGGEYLMETRLAGHRNSTVRKTVNLEQGAQTITLPAPTPIYGKLMVGTLPDLAEIYIDDHKVGETPQMLNQVLIGSHKVTIKKSGYKDLTKTINVTEGQTASVEGNLEKSVSNQSNSAYVYSGQKRYPPKPRYRNSRKNKFVSVRPYIGLSSTSIINEDKDLGDLDKLTAGVDVLFMLNAGFGLSAGGEIITGDVATIGAVFLANFYPVDGFDIKLGIKPTIVEGSYFDNYISVSMRDFDIQGVIGISYEIKNIVFEVRQNIGFLNIFENESRDYIDAAKLSNLTLSLGYRF